MNLTMLILMGFWTGGSAVAGTSSPQQLLMLMGAGN